MKTGRERKRKEEEKLAVVEGTIKWKAKTTT